MQSVTQIHLGHCLFSIEHDAHEKLSAYLGKLHHFFDKEDGGSETYNDIEDRIAELFLSKQKSKKHKVVIQLEDIEEIISIIGQPEELGIEEEPSKSDHPKSSTLWDKKNQRLYRSTRYKKIAGVSAGIGLHYNVDPIWIRLAFMISLFLGGLGLLVYIVLAIVLPEDNNYNPNYTYRKLYRINESRLLGGVCTGIAAYFQIPLIAIRLIFGIPLAISLFRLFFSDDEEESSLKFGVTIVVYLILWFVVPLATTSAEKLKGKGKPININTLRTEKVKQPSPIHNILEKILHMILSILKVIGAIILTLIVLSLFITLAGAVFGAFVIHSWISFFWDDLFLYHLFFVAVILLCILPFLALFLWAAGNLIRKKISGYVYISICVLWVISLFGVFSGALKIGNMFDHQMHITKEETISHIPTEKPLKLIFVDNLNASEKDQLRFFDIDTDEFSISEQGMHVGNIHLKMEAMQKGDAYFISTKYQSQGANKREALSLAKAIRSPFYLRSDTLFIEAYNMFNEQHKYRGQYIEITLYIPKNRSVQTGSDVLYFKNYKEYSLYASDGEKIVETESW